jgi:hypothetical protein
LLTISCFSAQAETVCTADANGQARPVNAVVSEHVKQRTAEGERYFGQGKLGHALGVYRRGLVGFHHPDGMGAEVRGDAVWTVGGERSRCAKPTEYAALMRGYQRAALAMAEKRKRAGYFFKQPSLRRASDDRTVIGAKGDSAGEIVIVDVEHGETRGWTPPGGLTILLDANLYQQTEKELLEELDDLYNNAMPGDRVPDHSGRLNGRLQRLQSIGQGRLENNDSLGILPEERAGIAEIPAIIRNLDDQRERIFERILERSISEEQRQFEHAKKALTAKASAFMGISPEFEFASTRAQDALKGGLKSLRGQAARESRLKAIALDRARFFEGERSYTAAARYYRIAGQRDKSQELNDLARAESDVQKKLMEERLGKLKPKTEMKLEKPGKEFDEEAARMAEEFGFELE